MKLEVFIDKEREEEVLVYAHAENRLVRDIRRLFEAEQPVLGYSDSAVVPLDFYEVCCFTVENNRVYALLTGEKLQLKLRLYQLEQRLPESFVRINQSCIANIRMIERFEAAFSGSLKVVFKNGYIDYVSRRSIKNVKERFGF